MKHENYLSDIINVPSGIPQDDYLSPLLFSICIYDITKTLKYSNYLLVDDTKLKKKIKCLNDAKKFQEYLNNLFN